MPTPIYKPVLPRSVLGYFPHCVLLAACSAGTPSAAKELQCQEASQRLGETACLHHITSDAEFASVSMALDQVDQVATAKYMVPARKDARLLPLIINSKRFQLHVAFLNEAFPELFPSLDNQQYLDLLFDKDRREYYVGSITKYRLPNGELRYGINVNADPSRPETVGCAEIGAVYRELSARLKGSPVAMVPENRRQDAWISECGVPVHRPDGSLNYEVYHRSVGYGTLRRLKRADVPAAIQNGSIGFQDILVLEEAPPDIDTVVSGIVTGTRQAALSHLGVRSASRNTPNCFQNQAYDYLAEWEGKLVRLECAADTLKVQTTTIEEAEKSWQAKRPPPVSIQTPDRDFGELVPFRELPLTSVAERLVALARFGAKGRNLAWLSQNMPQAFTPPGFLIPMHFYQQFMDQNRWQVDWSGSSTELSFSQTIDYLESDPQAQANPKVRHERLLSLQTAMRAAPCDAALLGLIRDSVLKVWNNDSTMVRFRSSSNAEDGTLFNGAGLYDSTSGCVADETDTDQQGPSRCDPKQSKERGVCRALTEVWASLWNPKAYTERSYYGIDQRRTAMGVLVSERIDEERANFVAFTGNPIVKNDNRYLLNAQLGELEVVSPPPGIWPEQNLLGVDAGKVVEIVRATSSSEAPPGTVVMLDEELRTIGAELARIAAIYPFDGSAPEGHTLLLDTEWKVLKDGRLLVKQVRPYLK